MRLLISVYTVVHKMSGFNAEKLIGRALLLDEDESNRRKKYWIQRSLQLRKTEGRNGEFHWIAISSPYLALPP